MKLFSVYHSHLYDNIDVIWDIEWTRYTPLHTHFIDVFQRACVHLGRDSAAIFSPENMEGHQYCNIQQLFCESAVKDHVTKYVRRPISYST